MPLAPNAQPSWAFSILAQPSWVFRFANLGSGSTGNATVVQARGLDLLGEPDARSRPSTLLIDCGLGPRELAQRLGGVGLSVADLDAVFITHEHSDHVGALPGLLAKRALPVWASAGTLRAMGQRRWAAAERSVFAHLAAQEARSGRTDALGVLAITPFAVPHDASEPLHLRISAHGRHLAVLSDLGHAPPSVVQALAGVHALMLEFNHDSALLQQGSYPPFLKRRVAGHLGHLSNAQSAALLAQTLHPGLHTVLLGHLSLNNNSPELALAAAQAACTAHQPRLICANAAEPSHWIEV